MGKTVNKAMTYEEIPLGKPSKASLKKQVKADRSKNINRMASWEIGWYLIYKHRVGLLVTGNILFIIWVVVR